MKRVKLHFSLYKMPFIRPKVVRDKSSKYNETFFSPSVPDNTFRGPPDRVSHLLFIYPVSTCKSQPVFSTHLRNATTPLVALAAPLLHAQPLVRGPQLLAAAALVRSKPLIYRLLRSGVHQLLPHLRARMPSFDPGQLLLHAGLLGSGVLSGLYFIFSVCVMRALNAQSPTSAISAMNAINTEIINPPFLLVFIGTPLVCAFLLGMCVREGIGASLDNKLTASGALALLLGEFLLTLVVHIPKNDALAAHTPGSRSDSAVWVEFYTSWTAWNHVRMLASMIAVVCMSSALQQRAARLAVLRHTPID